MGYYIPNNQPLSSYPDTEQITKPKFITDVEPNEAIIVEIDNGPFKAYGFAHSQKELDLFNYPDGRLKRYFKMPLVNAMELSGYKQDYHHENIS